MNFDDYIRIKKEQIRGSYMQSKIEYILNQQNYLKLIRQLELKDFSKPFENQREYVMNLTKQYKDYLKKQTISFQSIRQIKNYADFFVHLKKLLKGQQFQQYKQVSEFYDNFYMTNVFSEQFLVSQNINEKIFYKKRQVSFKEDNYECIYSHFLIFAKEIFMAFLGRQEIQPIQGWMINQKIQEENNKLKQNFRSVINRSNIFEMFDENSLRNVCQLLSELKNGSSKLLKLRLGIQTISQQKIKSSILNFIHQIFNHFGKFYKDEISVDQFAQFFKPPMAKIILHQLSLLFRIRSECFQMLGQDVYFYDKFYFSKQIILEQTMLNHLYYETFIEKQEQKINKSFHLQNQSQISFQQHRQRQQDFIIKCLKNIQFDERFFKNQILYPAILIHKHFWVIKIIYLNRKNRNLVYEFNIQERIGIFLLLDTERKYDKVANVSYYVSRISVKSIKNEKYQLNLTTVLWRLKYLNNLLAKFDVRVIILGSL